MPEENTGLSRPSSRPPRRGPGTYDRTQSTEKRREHQRRQLVDAAAHVFARDGFAEASVASILEVSGLSRGTFYRHFRDLRDVFVAVQHRSAEVLYDSMRLAYEAEGQPIERMRACIGAYLGSIAEHADLARVFHREARVAGSEYEGLRNENLGRMVELFRGGCQQAVEQGLLKAVPDDMTLYAVVVAIEGVGNRYLEEHREAQAVEAAKVLERLCIKVFT